MKAMWGALEADTNLELDRYDRYTPCRSGEGNTRMEQGVKMTVSAVCTAHVDGRFADPKQLIEMLSFPLA
jgi:hypothetical protein